MRSKWYLSWKPPIAKLVSSFGFPPEADPETKIQGQIIYLEAERGKRKVSQGREDNQIKQVIKTCTVGNWSLILV